MRPDSTPSTLFETMPFIQIFAAGFGLTRGYDHIRRPHVDNNHIIAFHNRTFVSSFGAASTAHYLSLVIFTLMLRYLSQPTLLGALR